jgi:ubiquinol-cytochrome c reductase cytochrome c1 subunit
MAKLRPLLAAAALLAAVNPAFVAPAVAAEEGPALAKQNWSFSGPFGTFDLAAAQRGFQIYSDVCSNCHSMNHLAYRELSGIGVTPAQIRAIAAAVQVPAGLNDQGEPVEGPGTPASTFRRPFANDKAARAANNGALPPDMSSILNAREGGADYIYGILTGYGPPPPDMKMGDGMMYNTVYPGHQIAMPQPLQGGQITYTDGTANTLEQEAHDVTTFLAWTSNPEMVERKRLGVRIALFLVLMTGVTYAVKRQVWADVH